MSTLFLDSCPRPKCAHCQALQLIRGSTKGFIVLRAAIPRRNTSIARRRGLAFKKNLASILDQLQITEQEAATLAGISTSSLYNWKENGRWNKRRFSQFAEALRVSVSQLLSVRPSPATAVKECARPYRREADRTICPHCGQEILVKVTATFVKAQAACHTEATGA